MEVAQEIGEITVQRASEKHLYSITAMTAHYFPYAGFTHSAITQRLENPNIVYLAAVAGGHCVGFIDYELKEGRAQILGLAVLDEWRGKGIARQLLEKSLQEIALAGKKRVDLLVAENNEAAKKLYSGYGFAVTGKLEKKLWDQEVLVYSRMG